MKTPYWFLHKTLLAFLLLPISWIYFCVSRYVFLFRKLNVYESKRPIICIGNILAGGVGKTPIVRCVANYFDAPVVMRGYKKTNETGNVGDEAKMLSSDGLAVHVGNRKSNIILLNKQNCRKPIIMDDGLQNPTIKKDVSIVVFDDGLGYGNGFLLPAGPLREPKSALCDADAIIVIKSMKPRKKFSLPVNIPIFYANNTVVNPYDKNERLFAFAGIGYPKKFFDSLCGVVGKKSFSDHYQYTDDDIKNLICLADKKNAKLITTEKDWVRLPEYARDKIKYAKLVTNIDSAFFDWIKGKVNADI